MIISIDVGINGAMAIKNKHGIGVVSMPKVESDIVQLLDNMHNTAYCNADSIEACYMEQVHSMPGQGVSSTFTFGKNYGLLRGIIQTLNIPLIDVSPQKWQKAIGVPKLEKDERKDWIYQFVRQTYPNVKCNKKQADALAILHYAISKKD